MPAESASESASVCRVGQRCDGLRVRLLAHVHATADELSPSRDESENLGDLRRALAAVSIEDRRTDFRDTFLALGPLYVSAARAGLSPGESFLHVAALSVEVPPMPTPSPVRRGSS